MPAGEMRVPQVAFGVNISSQWDCGLGSRISSLVEKAMLKSNCYAKTVCVTARILKGVFTMDREKIREPLTVEDIAVARRAQFMVSMQPTLEAMEKNELEPLRPIMLGGIIYMRTRCGTSLLELFGVTQLPILARQTRLARLIMMEAHSEDHRLTPTDVLARSRQRAWIVRGRYLAKEVCRACPLCKLNRRKLTQQLMSDIPHHQLRP